jgi:hypothetical protein
LQVQFGGQHRTFLGHRRELGGDCVAIGAAIGMAHQDQIARDHLFAPGRIDYGVVTLLFANHEARLQAALIEILNYNAEGFDR